MTLRPLSRERASSRAPAADPPPFFVVGAQRSGTTMLRLMLNRHPRLAVPFESGFIPDFWRALPRYGDLRERGNAAALLDEIRRHPKVQKGALVLDPDRILATPVSTYADLVAAIFREYAVRRGKHRWGDKTPAYVTEIDLLWTLFPGSQIIHLVRDGRDVAVSLSHLRWGSTNTPLVAQDWRWKTTLARKIGTVLGEHYLEARYEDLVLQPEGTLRRICTFLGEAYHPDMLTFDRDAESEMPEDSLQWHRNSVRAPDPTMINLWKRRMSRTDRIIFEQWAGPALELFGYEIEGHPRTLASRLKTIYYLAVRRT